MFPLIGLPFLRVCAQCATLGGDIGRGQKIFNELHRFELDALGNAESVRLEPVEGLVC